MGTLKRVLILEENTEHLELLTNILENNFSPIDIHTVEAVEDCLDFLEQTEYDLIMTGYLIHNTKITERLPEIVVGSRGAPVIVISGSGDESIAAEVIKLGAADYIVKTRKSLEKLPALVDKYFKKRRAKTLPTRPEGDGYETTGRLLREIDHIMQKARNITAGIATNKMPDDPASIESLFSQIGRLRKLIQEKK